MGSLDILYLYIYILRSTALAYLRPPQQLRACAGRRVLLHVFHQAVALGVAAQLAVHQEGALDVPVGADQLLKLLGGEGVGQVGEAEQGVGGLQRHVDQASPDSAVMEGADGILSLVPVQQSHKGWRRGHYGDSDERKRQTRTQDRHKEKRRTDRKWTMGTCEWKETNTNIHLKQTFKKHAESSLWGEGRKETDIEKKHAQSNSHEKQRKEMTGRMWRRDEKITHLGTNDQNHRQTVIKTDRQTDTQRERQHIS